MTSGNGDYGMYLDDPDMMSYKLSGEIFSMKALSAGSTSMSITDSTNRTITMNVTISKELELDERELTIELGESGYLHLVKGSERYGVEKNNNNVEVYRTNDETFEVKALTLGTTAIQITDEFDNATTANITVVEKGVGDNDNNLSDGISDDNKARFESFFLLNDSDSNVYNTVAFNVVGEYTEVGMEYKDLNGKYVRQVMSQNTEGFYILELDESICDSCDTDFQPYIIDNKGYIIYPNAESGYMSFTDSPFENVAIVNSPLGLASIKNEDIQVVSLSEYWRQVELASKDIIIFVLLNGVGIGGEAANNKISTHMLSKFMYGDGDDEYYNDNHWITQKLKDSIFYTNAKTIFDNNKSSYIGINEFEKVLISEFEMTDTGYIHEVEDSTGKLAGKKDDFYFSFGKVDVKLYAYKENNVLYMLLEINDDYDFHSDTQNIYNTTKGLSDWALYYQERGYGKIFHWELQAYETN